MMRGRRDIGNRAFRWFDRRPSGVGPEHRPRDLPELDRRVASGEVRIGVDLGLGPLDVGIKLVRTRYVS